MVDSASLLGVVPVVLFGHFEEISNCIPPESDLLVLNSASVAEAMRGQNRPRADALVAIVSRWPEFLRWSRTMLVAAGWRRIKLSRRARVWLGEGIKVCVVCDYGFTDGATHACNLRGEGFQSDRGYVSTGTPGLCRALLRTEFQ